MKIKPKKHLGQNFLNNEQIAKDIVNSLNSSDKDLIIEIGPGLGILTKYLINKEYKRLICVEIDKYLVQKLNFKQKNIEVINQNILDYLENFSYEDDFLVIGAIPYYITSPIIHKIIYLNNRPREVILVIQKEVAQKIISDAPNSSYLSAFTNKFYKTEILFDIESINFTPPPKVVSSVIKLSKKQVPKNFDVRKYEKFLHRMYQNPRKMINKRLNEDELKISKLKPSLRPQNVQNEEWEKIFKLLGNYRNT